jgi:hypothetical protein
VRISPLKGWRTFFDFANAKLEKKNEIAKRKVEKRRRVGMETLFSELNFHIFQSSTVSAMLSHI